MYKAITEQGKEYVEKIFDDCINGFHKYCLEEPFHLEYVSSSLCNMVGYKPEELLDKNFDGFLSLIHPHDVEKYQKSIQELAEKEMSKKLYYRLVCKNGDMIHISDVTISRRSQRGKMEAFGILENITDIVDDCKRNNQQKTNCYITALSKIYDSIYEYDFQNQIAKCIVEKENSRKALLNVSLALYDFMDFWAEHIVMEKDKAKVIEVYKKVLPWKQNAQNEEVLHVEYRSIVLGETRYYEGVFLQIDEEKVLFCNRDITIEKEGNQLKEENRDFRMVMKYLQECKEKDIHWKMVLKIKNEWILPLYLEENWKHLWKIDTKKWLDMKQNGISQEEFLKKSPLTLEKFYCLMQNETTELVYTDSFTGKKIKINLVFKKKDENDVVYLCLSGFSKKEYQVSEPANDMENVPNVFVKTFGYFDIFIDGKPIVFKNAKAKELLAILVDRQGGLVSSKYAIGILWENEEYSERTTARFRKVAMQLKNTLEEYGISDIMEKSGGTRRIIPSKIKCDLYDYLNKVSGYESLFKGIYLLNYSWAETTLASLEYENTGKIQKF
ncbi:MAG: PAS domain-containing protein [Lachnospiraceae bacterium]|nr:PAS domain-containing protein [Lachnospiraceae bacterium]